MKRNHGWREAGLALSRAFATAAAVALAAQAPAAFAKSRATAPGGACDAACLKRLMGAYLGAIGSDQPAPGLFAQNVVARENNKAVEATSALRNSVTKVRGGQTFADAVTGQAVFQGVLESRGGGLAVMFARIKVVDRKITELEIILNDNPKSPMFAPLDIIQPDIVYSAPVPVDRRSSRAEIKTIVDHYMDAIGLHDASLAPFSPRCDRWASGYKVTNNAKRTVEEGGGTCGESLEGLKGGKTVERRVVVIDPELGVASALFMIPHPERATPTTTYAAELFKIVDGRIRSIEEVSNAAAFPPNSGFPGAE